MRHSFLLPHRSRNKAIFWFALLAAFSFLGWQLVDNLPEPALVIHATYHPPTPPAFGFQKSVEAIPAPSPLPVVKPQPQPDSMIVIVNGRRVQY